MKKIAILLLSLLTITIAQAQQSLSTSTVEYQGEVVVALGGGIGSSSSSSLYLHTIQGVWVNPNISTGLGIGVAHALDGTGDYLPIYFNAKGFMPVPMLGCILFLSLDLGYSAPLSSDTTGGLYTSPAIGTRLNIGATRSINLSLSLDSQRMESEIKGAYTSSDALSLRVGFYF